MKEKIIEIISIDGVICSRRVTESYFKKNHYNIYSNLINKYKNLSFQEILYFIVNNLSEVPSCIICGKPVRFKKFSQGYSKYCSMLCVGNDKNVQIKREETSLNNFGEKYTLLSKDKREEIKKTNLEKYGVEYAQQSNIFKEKTKKTNLEKYGVEHHLKLKSQQEKQKKTVLLNYGVDNPMKNNEVKEKTKKTNLEKYGFTSYSKTDEFKCKAKKTNLEKYGVEYTFNSSEVKEKTKKTNLEKYGTSSFSSTLKFIKSVKKTKKERYGNENFNNREQSKKTSILKYGVDNPSKLKFVIDKICNTNINNFKKKYSDLLSIGFDDILVNNELVTIKKCCNVHDEFEISKSLLYSRLIFSKHENICTKCNPIAETSSIIENELKEFIKTLNITSINNDTTILPNNQEIDVFLPEHNLGIEFNGLYWHSELFKDKNYHLNKTNECEKRGIKLLHIFDDEWIYKKEIVKSIIRSNLGLIEHKIYARKCYIKEIDSIISSKFLDCNHIQGSVNSKINLGLFYENELISVMTFEITRIGLGNIEKNFNYYNLNRFCTKLNTQVIGGASKLLKYFIKTYNPKNIITYADRRYSQGKLYKNLNFTNVHTNKPTFYYFNRNKKIKYHRFNYRKDVLIKLGWFNETKTINEILLEHNILKVYDCGSIKYEMTF